MKNDIIGIIFKNLVGFVLCIITQFLILIVMPRLPESLKKFIVPVVCTFSISSEKCVCACASEHAYVCITRKRER